MIDTPEELDFDVTYDYSGPAFKRLLEEKTDREIVEMMIPVVRNQYALNRLHNYLDGLVMRVVRQTGEDEAQFWIRLMGDLAGWRGDMARAVKAEIKRRWKIR